MYIPLLGAIPGIYKKFELMLMRRAKAYSNSGSVI